MALSPTPWLKSSIAGSPPLFERKNDMEKKLYILSINPEIQGLSPLLRVSELELLGAGLLNE